MTLTPDDDDGLRKATFRRIHLAEIKSDRFRSLVRLAAEEGLLSGYLEEICSATPGQAQSWLPAILEIEQACRQIERPIE